MIDRDNKCGSEILIKTIEDVNKLLEGMEIRLEFDDDTFSTIISYLKDPSIPVTDGKRGPFLPENQIALGGCDVIKNMIDKTFQLGRTAKELELKNGLSKILNMDIK